MVVGLVIADVTNAIAITITINIATTITTTTTTTNTTTTTTTTTLQYLHTLAQMLAQELLHVTCNVDTDLIA